MDGFGVTLLVALTTDSRTPSLFVLTSVPHMSHRREVGVGRGERKT